MRRWLYAAVFVGIMIGGCDNNKPPLKVPVLSWIPGTCSDNFIVYKQAGGLWVRIDETKKTRVILNSTTKGQMLTVAGVCTSGPNVGEWKSTQQVVW